MFVVIDKLDVITNLRVYLESLIGLSRIYYSFCRYTFVYYFHFYKSFQTTTYLSNKRAT